MMNPNCEIILKSSIFLAAKPALLVCVCLYPAYVNSSWNFKKASLSRTTKIRTETQTYAVSVQVTQII